MPGKQIEVGQYGLLVSAYVKHNSMFSVYVCELLDVECKRRKRRSCARSIQPIDLALVNQRNQVEMTQQ